MSQIRTLHMRVPDPMTTNLYDAVTVIVEVDLEKIGRELARKAAHTKNGQCRYLNGAVKVLLLREDQSPKAATASPV